MFTTIINWLDTSRSNGSLRYSKPSLVNEHVSVPLSVVLRSLALIVCSIIISAKHPFEHFQVNSLLAGGVGVTEHVRLRSEPMKYSTALLMLSSNGTPTGFGTMLTWCCAVTMYKSYMYTVVVLGYIYIFMHCYCNNWECRKF